MGSLLGGPGVEGVAETVAHEIEGQQGEREDHRRGDQQPGALLHDVGAVLDHEAPGGHRGLDAEAEEADERLEHHDAGHGQGGVDRDDPGEVGEVMVGEDADLGLAERDRHLDELAVLERDRLGADDARHRQPGHAADGQEDHPDVLAEDHHAEDHDERERQRAQDVDRAHHGALDQAARLAGDDAVEHAEDEGDDRGEHEEREGDDD